MRRISIIFLLFIITALAAWLRIKNQSNFLFYPDSYRFLLIAQNLKKYLSVVAPLGRGGMPYQLPAHVSFMVGYPFSILLLSPFTKNLQQSAQIVSLLTAILSIPMIYFLAQKIFESEISGLIAAFILGLSFTHTAWSGFAMSESLAMLTIILSFFFIFSSLKKNSPEYLNIFDILAGIFFALAILTRPEYSLLILPTIFLYVNRLERFIGRVLTFLSAIALPVTIVMITIIRPRGQLAALWADWKVAAVIMLVALLSLVILAILSRRKYLRFDRIVIPSIWLITVTTIAFSTYLYWQIFFDSLAKSLPLYRALTAVRIFACYDFFLFLIAILGIVYLIFNSTRRYLGVWALLYLFVLAFLYQRTNVLSYRYTFHFLPPLIISSTFFGSQITDWVKEQFQKFKNSKAGLKVFLVGLPILLILLLQTPVTLKGMRGWYSSVNYEQAAARRVSQIIEKKGLPQNILILTRLVEPYFYYTKRPSWGIDQKYPYIRLFEKFPFETPVLVVVDEGVTRLNPDFATFAKNSLTDFEMDAFFLGIPFHFSRVRYPEVNPVRLYYLPAKTLKDIINQEAFVGKTHQNQIFVGTGLVSVQKTPNVGTGL